MRGSRGTILSMYTLYVGSPNNTHELDEITIKKIKQTASKYFESYTIIRARGVFKDTEEDMVMLKIADAEKSKVYALGEELRVFLRQDGVAVEHNGAYERLITK